MSESIRDRLASVKNVALRRALQPLFEAIKADLAAINANNRTFLTATSAALGAGLNDVDAGEIFEVDVTVTGAALGDLALAALSANHALVGVSAKVKSSNTVTVQIVGEAGASNLDLSAATVTVMVIPKTAASIATNTAA